MRNPYDYFKAALNTWVKETGTGYQKVLSIETGYGKSYISQLFNPKREKPISFEVQIKIAEACGEDYLSFLEKGRELLERKSLLKPEPLNPIVEAIIEFLDENKIERTQKNALKALNILKNHHQSPDSNISTLTHQHQELVKNFQDTKAGIEANELLIQLEKLDVEEFYIMIGMIKGRVKKLKKTLEKEEEGKAVSGE